MDPLRWRIQMNSALESLQQIDLGYPQGDNLVEAQTDVVVLKRFASEAKLPPHSPLLSFYRICHGASLPDVHVGYFIHSPELVMRGLRQGEPARVTGPLGRNIIVFGSDGGGNRFALGADGGEVLFLGDGAVRGETFDGAHGEIRIIAPDFGTFLERLLDDTLAIIADDREWNYLV